MLDAFGAHRPRDAHLRLPRARLRRRRRGGRRRPRPDPGLAARADRADRELAVLAGRGHRLRQLPLPGLAPLALGRPERARSPTPPPTTGSSTTCSPPAPSSTPGMVYFDARLSEKLAHRRGAHRRRRAARRGRRHPRRPGPRAGRDRRPRGAGRRARRPTCAPRCSGSPPGGPAAPGSPATSCTRSPAGPRRPPTCSPPCSTTSAPALADAGDEQRVDRRARRRCCAGAPAPTCSAACTGRPATWPPSSGRRWPSPRADAGRRPAAGSRPARFPPCTRRAGATSSAATCSARPRTRATGPTGSSSGWPWSSSGCSASASTSAAPSTCRPPAARSSPATTSASSTSRSSASARCRSTGWCGSWRRPPVFDHWFAGPFMRAMQHIPVDRKAGAAAFESAVRALKDGEVVGVFPEATISTSFTVKDLKAGVARMAVDAGVPIIPAAVWGGQRIATKGHKVRAAPRRAGHRHPRRADRRRAGGEGRRRCCAAPRPPWRRCSTRRSAATPTSRPVPTTAGGSPRTSAAPRPRPRRPPPRTPLRAAGKAAEGDPKPTPVGPR